MTEYTLDLGGLSLLVGLKTEFREGTRVRQGVVSGVFSVTDTGSGQDRFVVELSQQGRYYYVPYSACKGEPA